MITFLLKNKSLIFQFPFGQFASDLKKATIGQNVKMKEYIYIAFFSFYSRFVDLE